MEPAALYAAHLESQLAGLSEDLADTGYDALVLSAGVSHPYFGDDQAPPFRTGPHFRHWCPLEGPQHLLLLRPAGTRPKLFRHRVTGFWYEAPAPVESWWGALFELFEAETVDELWGALGPTGRAAFVGDDPERAAAAGLEPAPPRLLARLEWRRALKSAWEIHCIETASATAAAGHTAAQAAFGSGGSELEIHHAFVRATGGTEAQLPYPTIVALDAKGAILHYEKKRLRRGGHVLLIDAGAACRGYASDITRTHVARDCDPRFVALRDGVERLQQELCALVRPGLPFGDLHHRAHLAVGALLEELGIVAADPEEAVAREWTRAFFPHGLGHQLGIQVHDVGGHLADRDGAVAPTPPGHPNLRNTRTLAAGQVVTIEPGVYFIGSLLAPLRTGPDAGRFDWKAIDALAPLGGVRIEDDVLVTERGCRNLTREAFQSRAAA
jgi:Xaa-Pro dipeptidase